jgi:signal transduction histidine kinase/ActR/RegA family two-component response regulator
MFSWLIELAEKRVQKYGAQYYTYGIFGLINYPLAYLYESHVQHFTGGLWFRMLSALLCSILLLKEHWPNKLRPFLPLYWYLVIAFSIPVLSSYMLLLNKFSLGWLINFNVGVMIAILVLDVLSFLLIEILGTALGLALFYLLGHTFNSLPTYDHISLFIYMFSCIVILGSIFSRNKEIYNDYLQKAKDGLNVQLEHKVAERTAELASLNKNLEHMVEERTIDLQKALSAKTEFLNNMSHEIRTPVQGFVGISDGLLNKWRLLSDDEKFSYIKMVASSGKRLGSLVGNLLDLSKFQVGKITLHLIYTDMNHAIEAMIDECQTLYLTEKKIKIKYINEAHNTHLNADEELLGQVLRNLFTNAIKFSNSGIELVATLRDTKLDGVPAVHFSLRDQGVGIPEDELHAIFESFVQSSHTKTKAGGTGLGLAICKEIIELHSGKIWAENNPDSGATFHFIIPCSQDRPEIEANKDGKQFNILIVDDEEICHLSMETIIFGTNYHLAKATGGIKGLEYLRNNPDVDLVMLDLMMPDMYGLNVLAEIRNDPKLAHLRVILQSGTSDFAEVKKAEALGIIKFIKKPYRKDVVLQVLSKVLGNDT